jgi:hypothetical protein
MMNSKILKTFVKMHEYKLNAKINGLHASRLESQIEQDLHGSSDGFGSIGAYEHWSLQEADRHSRRRPKSRYFNFIMTPSHQ